MYAIDDSAKYVFTGIDDDSEFVISGKALNENGFNIALKEKRTAKAYIYRKCF